jgi:hypothetical protein
MFNVGRPPVREVLLALEKEGGHGKPWVRWNIVRAAERARCGVGRCPDPWPEDQTRLRGGGTGSRAGMREPRLSRRGGLKRIVEARDRKDLSNTCPKCHVYLPTTSAATTCQTISDKFLRIGFGSGDPLLSEWQNCSHYKKRLPLYQRVKIRLRNKIPTVGVLRRPVVITTLRNGDGLKYPPAAFKNPKEPPAIA